MTDLGQSADDFAGVVAMATNGQQQQPQVQPQQQTPIQQHFVSTTPPPEQVSQANPVASAGDGTVIPSQAHANVTETQTVPEVQPTETQTVPEVQPTETQPKFNLDDEIDNLFKEFGITTDDNEKLSPPEVTDNDKLAEQEENDNKSIAKNEKINIILEKLAEDRDRFKNESANERFEKEQYKLAAEKLQNKLSEEIEKRTALEYDENKIQVTDGIKDFVHFYNKRSSQEKDEQTPDSVLTKRTLAEATKVVEAITGLNLDNYLSAFYLKSNPQIPKIGNNHYSVDQLGLDQANPQQRTVQEKKADPKRNPMEDRF